MANQKIINLGAPSNPNDAARKTDVDTAQSAAQTYTDTQLAAVVSGQTLKGAVRAVSTTNVTLATPGTTIDGLTAANGEIFLLAGQTTGSQNGPYVFNGSASPMTRATNWDSAGEAVVGSYWVVREGTNADKFALMTNDSFTLNTTTAAFAYIGSVAGGGFTSFKQDVPAISAGATGTITHNLNTRDVAWALRLTGSPYNYVTDVEIEATTVNTLDIKPDVAMTSAQYRIMIWAT
jgi:hypothetical protein